MIDSVRKYVENAFLKEQVITIKTKERRYRTQVCLRNQLPGTWRTMKRIYYLSIIHHS